MSNLKEQFQELQRSVTAEFASHASSDEKQEFRQRIMGRKGKLAEMFGMLEQLPLDERKEAGRVANETKESLEKLFSPLDAQHASLSPEELERSRTWSLSQDSAIGMAHPLTGFMNKTIWIFRSMGFDVVDGPELEDEKHNFDLLNIPADHPARDAWDTFFVKKPGKAHDAILRTHTSPMQLRSMKNRKPPVRIIIPGRVFRHEATDASHGAVFYQCEGFLIDKGVTLADLMGTLDALIKELFGKKTETRFRPHYYPFVEPGMDVDMKFKRKGSDEPEWLEVLGSGMIHPKVLRNMGVDPEVYSGFAFGLGIDRLAMLYWGIDDIRHLYSGSLNFLRHFR